VNTSWGTTHRGAVSVHSQRAGAQLGQEMGQHISASICTQFQENLLKDAVLLSARACYWVAGGIGSSCLTVLVLWQLLGKRTESQERALTSYGT